MTRHVRVRPGDVVLLVRTTKGKGLFLFRGAAARRRWELGGLHHAGAPSSV